LQEKKIYLFSRQLVDETVMFFLREQLKAVCFISAGALPDESPGQKQHAGEGL